MNSQYKKLLKHLDKKYPGLYMTIVHSYKSFKSELQEEYTVYVEYNNIQHKGFKTFKEMKDWILAL
jgi:hypothetical protein